MFGTLKLSNWTNSKREIQNENLSEITSNLVNQQWNRTAIQFTKQQFCVVLVISQIIVF